ncbi:hypothetical protein [Cellulosimicrobium sp. CUA-896]|uniref:hypothetical protein n=1 Tax=Cellulosimicrobium sp. CUA-896 TaxID=1517881 RepID=UPI002101AF23|nr:hypothetical protein [Cellulosimicrobium sp. CUA-896]
MAAQLVRLKLTLMANAFRRSAWQTIGFVIGSLYGLFVVGLVVTGTVALGTSDPVLAGAVTVLVGAVAVLAWWIVPLFAFGVDATLDPQRFVLFGIPQRRLLAGLALAGTVSIPGIATGLSALGVSFAWWRTPLAVLAALVGALLALALCVVGSRATTTALAPLLESRRYREVVTIAAFVPLMLVGPAFGWFASQMGDGPVDGEGVRDLVERLAAVVAWTPFGAPWGLGAAVHDGAWGLALARLVVALVALAVAWVVWDRSLARALVTPPTHGAGGRARVSACSRASPRRRPGPSRRAPRRTGCATRATRGPSPSSRSSPWCSSRSAAGRDRRSSSCSGRSRPGSSGSRSRPTSPTTTPRSRCTCPRASAAAPTGGAGRCRSSSAVSPSRSCSP